MHAKTAGTPSADAELDARRAEWMRVVNGRDVDAYAHLLVDDVVWFPPGQPPILGRAAFTEWVRPFFAAYEYDFTIERLALSAAKGFACERARFESRMRTVGSGAEQLHGGTCIVLWRREPDGVWRIERYVDESVIG